MPRKSLIRSKVHPYHVTARSNNRVAFTMPLPIVWNLLLVELGEVKSRFDCRIHALVLMPNHFHLLISTPGDDLGVVMGRLLSSFTRKLNRISGSSGRVFGARYHWSMIDHLNYYDCALKYVYRNPVKARLAESVESYAFSTFSQVAEGHFPSFEIEPPVGVSFNIPENDTGTFKTWLNQPFRNEEEASIRSGLKKRKFSPVKSKSTNSPIVPDRFTYEIDQVLTAKEADTL